jgi:two-component system, LuxR family, response regulator FixJ
MHRSQTIILLDSDYRRRAAITHCLIGTGIHVEPYEDVGEITRRWPRDGVILVHDDGMTVGTLLKHMTEIGDWLPLVAFAEAPEPGQVVKAVLDGAIDFLSWPFGVGEIRQALLVAEESVGTLGSARLREAMARSRIRKLTRREREVLTGVTDGLSNRLIGERLEISPRTVEIHRANMLTKMGASHTSEAIRIAIEAAVVS